LRDSALCCKVPQIALLNNSLSYTGMKLLFLLATGTVIQKLSGIVTGWLVPLFILFNLVGWVGLAQREADRSRPPYSRQSYEETADLGTAIWRAWLAGILLALIVLWFLTAYRAQSSQAYNAPLWAAMVIGAAGLLAGALRGVLPGRPWFRNMSAIARRRTSSFLVFFAVAISAVCGALYYDPSHTLRNLVASGYACLLLGYMVVTFSNVGK
jgi:hypothetical protein